MQRYASFLLFLVAVTAAPLAIGQAPPPGGAGTPGKVDPPATEREKKILALFTANRKYFKDGKVILEYDFEHEGQAGEELVKDWLPALEETKRRIRWAGGYEGTWTRLEHGIILGDFGEWIHKAVFLADLEMKVEVLRVSQFRPGSILGPIFFNAKKKMSLGVNGGHQAVCLKGWKPVRAHPASPKSQPAANMARQTLGYKYDGKKLECTVAGRKTMDTTAQPRFTEGFDSGRPGIAWGTGVQSFLFKVSIEGRLDPDWVARELGEKSPAAEARATRASRS